MNSCFSSRQNQWIHVDCDNGRRVAERPKGSFLGDTGGVEGLIWT